MRLIAMVMLGLLLAGLALACAPATPYRVSNYFLDPDLRLLEGKTVAVLPFADAADCGSGREDVTDQANLQLGALRLFHLVERLRVQELFNEQDFDPDRLDQATAVKIGRMLGAHGVLLGTITDYEKGRVGISMRLVAVETGKQLWQARDTFNFDDARVRALVSSHYDIGRLRDEPSFLALVLCRELARTLQHAQ